VKQAFISLCANPPPGFELVGSASPDFGDRDVAEAVKYSTLGPGLWHMQVT